MTERETAFGKVGILLIPLLALILLIPSHASEPEDAVEGVKAAADLEERVERLKEVAGIVSGDEWEAESFVFIGDSRTVGMEQSVSYDPEDTWSAKVSMGYSWMTSEGVPNVEGSIGDGTAVFILLGINDLGNIGSYISYADAKAAEWAERGARTFFCAVGPVGNTTVTNGQIEAFNARLASELNNAEYVDIYSLLTGNGYATQDGLHYTGDTYRLIYDYLKSYA